MVFPFTNPLTSPPNPVPQCNVLYNTGPGSGSKKKKKKRGKGHRKSSRLSITLDYDRRMVSNDITK